MVDDLTGLGKITEAVIGAIRPFSDPVMGAFGKDAAQRIQWRTWKNAVRIAKEADQILASQRIEPGHVVPKLLLPILEGASLETEDDLLGRWANLLAAASSGKDILPSYADILRQLTPADVELLDWLSGQPPKLDHGVLRVMATCGDARRALGWELGRLALIVDNLIRHRVLGLGALAVDDMGQEEYLVNDGRELVFTTLGRAFIEACRHPSQKAEEPGPKKEE